MLCTEMKYNKDFLENFYHYLEGKFGDDSIMEYGTVDDNDKAVVFKKEFNLQNYKEYCSEWSEYSSLEIRNIKWSMAFGIRKEGIYFNLTKKKVDYMGEEEILDNLKSLNNIADIIYSHCYIKSLYKLYYDINSPFFLYAKGGDGRIIENIVLGVRSFIYWGSECFIENGGILDKELFVSKPYTKELLGGVYLCVEPTDVETAQKYVDELKLHELGRKKAEIFKRMQKFKNEKEMYLDVDNQANKRIERTMVDGKYLDLIYYKEVNGELEWCKKSEATKRKKAGQAIEGKPILEDYSFAEDPEVEEINIKGIEVQREYDELIEEYKNVSVY